MSGRTYSHFGCPVDLAILAFQVRPYESFRIIFPGYSISNITINSYEIISLSIFFFFVVVVAHGKMANY